jgi:hypothetical protein
MQTDSAASTKIGQESIKESKPTSEKLEKKEKEEKVDSPQKADLVSKSTLLKEKAENYAIK